MPAFVLWGGAGLLSIFGLKQLENTADASAKLVAAGALLTAVYIAGKAAKVI